MDASGQLDAANELKQRACQRPFNGRVPKELDLSQADPRTPARYDTGPI